jgi:hypothetical protein
VAPRPSPRFLRRSAPEETRGLFRPPIPPRALIGLLPGPEIDTVIHEVLTACGVTYSVPVRVTLQTGIDPRVDGDWRDVVGTVVHRHAGYTVRLRGPDVIADRTVVLRVVDQATILLRDDVNRALRANGFLPPDEPAEDLTVALAGTWTDLDRTQVHQLAAMVRDRLPEPIEFAATKVYAFDESAEDGLPRAEFHLA